MGGEIRQELEEAIYIKFPLRERNKGTHASVLFIFFVL